MTYEVVYEQHPIFFDYINTILSNEFNTYNSKIISYVSWKDNAFTVLAVIAYHGFMKHSLEMSIAGEPGLWATRKFIRAAYYYPFYQEGKEKVITTVLTNNERSIALLERLGHRREGCLEDYQGVDKDCFIYGLTKRQYNASRLAPKEGKQQ
jgi:hypothetical protein